MIEFLAVALGGALGAMLRYATSLLALKWFGAGFPIATLMVNCAGSFAMGALYTLSLAVTVSPLWKGLIGVGFLGALTTFSTFSNETLLLMQEGLHWKALLNVLLNVGLCLFMVYLGQQWMASQQ
ncbi:fluoride efflux transporter CrcB [Ferrimonas marina]|uniref:Fluoride-specific ion channel FluC n=1 Tax=Ferrimonas marina TaxID=299255 RepID=A0A1M5N4D9_9GAMM|nr:fluoride efflux transporter CrcB [Ferrimonas marina]SHG84436.1 CrcB protein [Ferrimonas marina]